MWEAHQGRQFFSKENKDSFYKAGTFYHFRLLEDAFYTDVVFVVHGESIPAHKSVLSARSVYFNDMFHTKWRDRREIHLNNQLVVDKTFP